VGVSTDTAHINSQNTFYPRQARISSAKASLGD
jgi:hypothetical protein